MFEKYFRRNIERKQEKAEPGLPITFDIEEFSSEDQDVGVINMVHHVKIGGEDAGDFRVLFIKPKPGLPKEEYQHGEAHMVDPKLKDKFRGLGYGKEIYKMIGESLIRDYGFTLRSDDMNDNSEGVWKSLEGDGYAEFSEEKGRYYFIDKDSSET